MNKLKQQFSDLRKNTPKHIQWLLLAAAFVVVLILLTLILTREEEETIENKEDVAILLNVTPDSVEMTNVTIGAADTETITISSSAPVKILDVRVSEDTHGLTEKNTCTTGVTIDSNISCSVDLTYKPTIYEEAHAAALYIDWRGVNENATKTTKVVIVIGSKKIELPEPEPEPIAEIIPEPIPEEVPSYKEEIQQDLEIIAPSDPLIFDEEKKSEPVIESDYVRPSEACSDFAMPGYNLSGVQSGWIRPSGGAYYYHPFSDKSCKNPTGIYNPDNGIITDINNHAQKIGTDAEHIGYTTIQNGTLPQLSNPATNKTEYKARQLTDEELFKMAMPEDTEKKPYGINIEAAPTPEVQIGTTGLAVFSSDPYDRRFVLRQYKPIPATIVSEVRADPKIYKEGQPLPVRATVDRNVYADDGRTIIIPTGTLMLGYVAGTLPGPYQTIGRMEIKWYQFILPSGVEFNFDENNAPFSGDSQGRAGVPGHGSTDYVEQLVMPMLTAIVPAAVNMIAPISDAFINQIDLDNNTVVQSGTIRSSELAKNEIITAWNQVAQKLIVDAMDNTVPPFSIAAGTRITVYSPMDLVITCGKDNSKDCSVDTVVSASGKASSDENAKNRNTRFEGWKQVTPTIEYDDPSWVGQVRSFNFMPFCAQNTTDGTWDIKTDKDTLENIIYSGYDYRTILAYCQSLNYQAINNAKQDAYYKNQVDTFKNTYNNSTSTVPGSTSLTGINGSKSYNEDILGLTYDGDVIQNPFVSTETATTETTGNVITCEGGVLPDEFGCCPGEVYTDMGEQGFNCCPEGGGDCFPPIL